MNEQLAQIGLAVFIGGYLLLNVWAYFRKRSRRLQYREASDDQLEGSDAERERNELALRALPADH